MLGELRSMAGRQSDIRLITGRPGLFALECVSK